MEDALICEICKYPISYGDDGKARCQCPETCPCGCGDGIKSNCVYDTAENRHLKNLMNGLPDEQWVVEMLAAQRLQADAAQQPYGWLDGEPDHTLDDLEWNELFG